MAKIGGVIGQYKGKFLESNVSQKNNKYITFKFAVNEVYGGVTVPVSQPNFIFTLSGDEAVKLSNGLRPQETYAIEAAVKARNPKGEYSAGIDYTPVKILGQGGQQVYPV